MRKWILYAISVWGGLLLLGGLCAGVGALQLRSASNTIRNDNLSMNDAQNFSREIALSNALLKSARYNPGIQILRAVPGVSWAPKALSVGSRAVSEVHSLLENGGNKIAKIALSGELTPEPGAIDVDAALVVAQNAQLIEDRLTKIRSAVLEFGELSIPGIDDSRIDKAVKKATDYLEVANSAVTATKQMPRLIGSETPMRYFVGITNEAELRGLQGIIGEFAIVELERGKISVSRTGSNIELVNPQSLPLELIGEYSDVYGENNTEWQNVNLSPFLDPAAAQITYAWELQTGEELDGVMLLDTVALSKWAIPELGSVQSALGKQISTWESLADYLSNGIYFDFPTDQLARKQFQTELARQLIEAITNSSFNPQVLIRNLAQPMRDGRLVAWLNGDFGKEFNSTFIARSSLKFLNDLVIGMNNLTGNKMDFYLRVDAEGSTCSAVMLNFLSSANQGEGYPEYFTRRLDLDSESAALIGSFLQIDVILPKGTSIQSVRSGKSDIAFYEFSLKSKQTLVRIWVEVLAGENIDVLLDLKSNSDCKEGRIRMSPLRQDRG